MQNKKFRLRNNLILNILFSFSSVTLALFGFLAVLPPATEPEASAIIDGEQFALTVTNSEAINLEINPTDSGSIAVAKDTIVANTNSPAGYKLYVSTDSTTSNDIHLNGRESNDTADKKLVATTGTNELPTQLENNSWGFAIAGAGNFDATYNTENPSTTSKFAAVPQKDAEQLIHDHTGRATDDQTEIYFAAKANTSIASGNYQTTILYTTLSEATDQDQTEINVEDGVLPADYTNKTVTLKTSIMLSKTPTLKVEVSNIEAQNVQIINEKPLELSFTVPENLGIGDHDLKLTLTNLAKSYTKPKAVSIHNFMQDMTPELCESLPLEEQQQFIDKRDGKVYWIAKLKDGNCWMTQNLDYDLSTTTTLTPADSDVTENWTPSRATIAGAANLNSTNWTDDGYTPYSFDPGNYYSDGTYYDSAECNYLTTTCDHFATTPYDLNGEHGHVGNYYNWSAAVASNDTSAIAAGTEINTSICPKGWRLPHGSDSASGHDFATLNTAYGGATNSDSVLLANPLFFVRGGYVYSGSLNNPAVRGKYWFPAAYRGSAAFFDFTSHYVISFNLGDRSSGYSVRCLARKQTKTLTIKDQSDDSVIATYDFETTFNLPEAPTKDGYSFLGYDEDKTATTPTYSVGDTITESKTLYAIYEKIYPLMQDVSSWKNTLTLEQQIQVKDARDDKIYWVSKLKDGNIWMTQNLDLDLSATTTLTPADSDVTANWTPSRATIAGAANISSYTSDDNTPYSFDPGNYYFDGTYFSSAICNYLTTTCDHFAQTPYELNGEHGHVGNYYNWSAAVASNNTSATTAKRDINTSICPKGWRLPHGSDSASGDDFATLNTAYGGVTNSDSVLLANPLFFVRGGYVGSGSLRNSAHNGDYWSSTAYSATYADTLHFYSSHVGLDSASFRSHGFSVRCLAR